MTHIYEVRCPRCQRYVPAVNHRLVLHGPGKNDLFCDGTGVQSLDLPKRRAHSIIRKIMRRIS